MCKAVLHFVKGPGFRPKFSIIHDTRDRHPTIYYRSTSFRHFDRSIKMNSNGLPQKQGLYDPQFEHDACGVGFIVHMKGNTSHEIVAQALTMLVNLDHRGACGAETNSGDGAGILMQVPHKFLQKVATAANITLPEVGQYGVGMIYTSPDR